MNQDNFIQLNKIARNFAAGFSKISNDFEVTIPELTAHQILINKKTTIGLNRGKPIVVYVYSRKEVIIVTPDNKIINPDFDDLTDLVIEVYKITLNYFNEKQPNGKPLNGLSGTLE